MPGTLTCALHATQRGARPARCLNERDARSGRVRPVALCSDSWRGKTRNKTYQYGLFRISLRSSGRRRPILDGTRCTLRVRVGSMTCLAATWAPLSWQSARVGFDDRSCATEAGEQEEANIERDMRSGEKSWHHDVRDTGHVLHGMGAGRQRSAVPSRRCAQDPGCR